MAIPCLVLREVKPPLHPLPEGCHLRALLGLISGVLIAMKSANKLTPDGRLASILVGIILFAASSVFFIGNQFSIGVCLIKSLAILAFFISSMYWSKFKKDQKKEFDPDHHSGNTRRNAINVCLYPPHIPNSFVFRSSVMVELHVHTACYTWLFRSPRHSHSISHEGLTLAGSF